MGGWSKGPGVCYFICYGDGMKYKAKALRLKDEEHYANQQQLYSNSNPNGAWVEHGKFVRLWFYSLTIRSHMCLIIVEDKLGKSCRQNLTKSFMCACDNYFGQSDS